MYKTIDAMTKMYTMCFRTKPRKLIPSAQRHINMIAVVKLTMTLDEARDRIRKDLYYQNYAGYPGGGNIYWCVKPDKTTDATVIAVALAARRDVV